MHITHTLMAIPVFMVALSTDVPGESVPRGPVITDGEQVTLDLMITSPDTVGMPAMTRPERFTYIHGNKNLLPGLERALSGMAVGEHKIIPLTADDAAGPYDETKKERLARNLLPPGTKAGDVLRTAEGRPITVLSVNEETVLVDFNHPLAGKRVVIDVTVVGVKPLQ